MRILVSFRAIPQSPGWATGDLLTDAFKRLGHDVYTYAKFYEQNRWLEDPRKLLSESYDLSLFTECNDGDSQYTELKNVKAERKACWLFDTSYYPDECKSLVRHFGFDHIFLANPLTINNYKEFSNVHYLPYACCPSRHFRPSGFPKRYDVALVGSIREDRKQLAKDLKRCGIDLQLIDGRFREDYIDALASSKIIINQNPIFGRGLLNMRHFETQAAGSILFEQFQDLKINYGAGYRCEGVISYKTPQDIPQLCDMFLNDKSIAQDYVLKHHTYENRCKTILETIK